MVDPFKVVVNPEIDIVESASIVIVAPFRLALEVPESANSAPVTVACWLPVIVVVAPVTLAVLVAVVEKSAAVIVKFDVGAIVVSADEVNDEFPVLFMVKVPSAEWDVFLVDLHVIVSAFTVKV